ncbi:MAG: OB-fold nucleic acid binding domain-containing protein, partial [Acidimicrobiia bacterium]
MSEDIHSEDADLDDLASLDAHPLTRDRLAKYRKTMEDGGFPYSFSRTDTAADLQTKFEDLGPGEETGEVVVVAGRLMNTRAMGKLVFGVLTDGSGSIQLFVDKRT